jgi:AcrR family transcriptional regulator
MAAPLRTARARWVAEGLRFLSLDGPDAVRIEKLAAALGVSKGGFYGHFDDRGSLLDEMLDTWEREGVDEVMEHVEQEGGDAHSKLKRLSKLAGASSELMKVELAIRDWARRDAGVAARVRRTDRRRMDYLRGLFSELCSEEEAEVRSLLLMSLWIGNHLIAAERGIAARNDALRGALRWLEAPSKARLD